MITTKSWTVRPSAFPFGVSTEVLGTVNGVDKRDAQQKAEDLYGRAVVVEPAIVRLNDPEQNRLRAEAAFGPPSRQRSQRQFDLAPVRQMTADEAQMARAVASCSMLRASKHRAAMRMLHARSLRSDRSITEDEARVLRSCVIAFKAVMPKSLVELAGGTP